MPFLTAHLLDRANEWVVRLRLAGRLPPAGGAPALAHLRSLGDRVHPAPRVMESLEPSPISGRMWRATTPWPEARGNNRTWYAERIVTAADGQRPALILLHGWLLDRPQLLIYRHWARRAAARGIDVWMPRLPYHLERAEAGEVSGQRCLSPDLATSLDAVRQATAEVRLLAAWLRRRGVPRIGLWGMSLGGWVAALAATLDADWRAVALWAPVASPAEVLFESPLVELLRDAVAAGGISAADFAVPEFAAMAPERRALRVPRSRVLVVAATHDRVIAPRSIARMARRWNVDVRWVPHGHISLMSSRAPVRDTVNFLSLSLTSKRESLSR